VQSGERILPPYHPNLSARAAESLNRLGVEVTTGGRVTDVGSDHVTVAFGDQSEIIPTHTVLWAAGVKASPLGSALAQATGAPLDRSGRVEVEADLTVPGHPEIFVLGDLASFTHDGGTPLPGVAQVAIQQGRYVGELVQRRLRGQAMPAFHYRDLGNMATIGRNAAVAEIGRLRLTGFLAWVIWLIIHLMHHTGVENRVLVAVQWVWNYVKKDRSALLITEREQPQPTPPAPIHPRLATDSGTWPLVR
jgi:NADH dehydrogenase